ncbi:hypothetical protein Tco_0556387, partial [Tanacetum coccineum]
MTWKLQSRKLQHAVT